MTALSNFKIISNDEAPAPPSRAGFDPNGAKKREYDNAVKQIADSKKTGKVELNDGDNPRGVKSSFAHAGKRNGIRVNSWYDNPDEPTAIFIRAEYDESVEPRKAAKRTK